MKYILSILLFLVTININSQQIISLCNESITKKYSVELYDGTYWDITPNLSMNIDNNIVYITYNNIGTYILTVTYDNGYCENTDKLIIDVIECNETTIWVPNSFTPNDDYDNDVFGAYGLNINSFNMRIYNRWGELLFESFDLNDRWDGYYQKNPCQEDVYSCIIIYQDNKNRFFQLTTTINLIH